MKLLLLVVEVECSLCFVLLYMYVKVFVALVMHWLICISLQSNSDILNIHNTNSNFLAHWWKLII